MTAGPGTAPLTVAVLTWNSARTIGACLASIATQDTAPAEVIVVDDDSTDATLEVVRAATASVGVPVRILRNGSHNISRGRNQALEASMARRVAFLDSDAYAGPNWLSALAMAFDGPDAPAVVGGGVRLVHTSAFSEAVAVSDELVRDLFARGALLVNGCNMAVDLDRIGPARFDPAFVHAEDIEFLERACSAQGWRLAPDAAVDHESRSTPLGYLRQMHRYGYWKVRYALRTGRHRPVDYVPSAVAVASVLAAPWQPLTLLALPALGLAETAVVLAWRRPPPRLAARILAGWTAKNVGWGAGVLVGVGAALSGALGRAARVGPIGAAG